MAKHPKSQSRKPSSEVRSVTDLVQDLAGTVLFEAGFSKKVLDKEELVEILRTLEDCREEGRALYPEILLTTKLDNCLKPIHPVQLVICGESDQRPGRFRRALKRCAAVASEPWVIVLEVSSNKLRYGVATTNVRADAESLYEAVFESAADTEDLPLMFLRRHGARAVLVRTVREQRVISLTLSDELLRATEDILSFARIACATSNAANRSKSERVVQRLLEQACREGHGFISCVVDDSDQSITECKEALSDGAWLAPAIDLSAAVPDQLNSAATLQDDSALRARINLARHMVEVDLMTMFSSSAKLVGYNIHIPSPVTAGVTGGARTRAFNALKQFNFLKAIFMCSQDGQTTFIDLQHEKQ
jgi:hypothetical protein